MKHTKIPTKLTNMFPYTMKQKLPYIFILPSPCSYWLFVVFLWDKTKPN